MKYLIALCTGILFATSITVLALTTDRPEPPKSSPQETRQEGAEPLLAKLPPPNTDPPEPPAETAPEPPVEQPVLPVIVPTAQPTQVATRVPTAVRTATPTPQIVTTAPVAQGGTSAAANAIAKYFPEQIAFATKVATCESGMNPATNTGNGYYGMWQFNLGTWQSVGGTGLPSNATADEQTMRARMAYNSRGWQPWGCA